MTVAQLWHANMAPVVVCRSLAAISLQLAPCARVHPSHASASGGVAHTDDLLATAFRSSEAEAFADRMCQCGVPSTSIIREIMAKNTGRRGLFGFMCRRRSFSLLVILIAMLLLTLIYRYCHRY